MASILRSSKFVRYIAGFARNVVVNTPREFDGNLINNTQCLCGALQPNSFATQATVQHDQNLEKSLKRIDQDVRKSGRISRRDLEDVLEEIRNARSATSSQSLLVIRCCGNLVPEEMPEVRTKLVQEIWNTLNKLNIPMDISHYNALLRVYLENEHSFSPTEFLSELEGKGIEPNRVTYQRLIARYCQQGDIEGATKILEFMREKQLPVNENVFNALIVGHSQTGDMDSAHGILAVMNQAGLEPSADTYTTLLAGYARKGDIETISKLFEECEEKEIYLLDKDYLDIVYSLAINGHNEHVPAILEKVKKAHGYNQDAINLILRLVNKEQEETAFLVLKSMQRNFTPEGTPLPTGGFFLKQLVKANRPKEQIVKICSILEGESLHETALLLATEFSLELPNEVLAYGLLEEIKNKGYEVRQHYFWPLILSKSKDKTGQGIVEVLLEMNKFGLNPSGETLRDYVIPNLHMKSSEIISLLREANVSIGNAASSLVYNLLMKHEIEEAAVIASSVNAYFRPDLLKKPLTVAYNKTKDLESYITILRIIQENVDRKSNLQFNDEGVNDKSEVVGDYLIELSRNNVLFNESIENILNKLVEIGLSISTTAAEKVQDKIGEKMTEEISNLLGKLTSGELTPVPVIKKPPAYTPSHQMTIPQLERLIHNLDAKQQDTKRLKRQLLTLYHRAKDIENYEALLNSLEDGEFVHTPGIYAQLVDLHAYHDNLEKATYYLEKLKGSESELVLDDSKIIRLAQLYVKTGKFDEGIALLESSSREKGVDNTFNYSMLVWRFLNSLAEEGRVEDLNKLFDTLVKKEFIDINNVMLGPLIKVHLVKDEIIKALDKFEWCVNQYKTTPWKNELACKLIQTEDAESLQRLTDLSTSVHGEINSLYDLVFAFVECGRIRQARKILETPGLQNRPNRINNACERYQQEGLIKPLEGLKDATKDLNHIDRTDIYYQLLLSYIKQEDTDKALGLWTQMQEDNIAPTSQFLHKLGTYLQERGENVPFALPIVEQEVVKEVPKPAVKSALQIFRQKIRNDDLDGALNVKNRCKNTLTPQDISLLIEKCVQNDRVNDAVQITLDSLDNNVVPLNRIFKFLLNKLAVIGDVDSLYSIGSKINLETKKLVSFDNRICHANLVAGRAEDYLNKLEQDIDTTDTNNLSVIGEQFPRGGAYGILEKHPELLDKYESIAMKYSQKGVIAPLNVLWTHYFIQGNHEKAEEIWNSQLKNSPRIMFQRIVQSARDTANEELISKLIEHLKSSTVTEGAIGNAYSCYLDVLSSKDKPEEIVTVFENAVKDVNVNFINRTAVLRVKEVYEKLGKPFNHTVPNKVVKNIASNTSSSSSSDEDKNKVSQK